MYVFSEDKLVQIIFLPPPGPFLFTHQHGKRHALELILLHGGHLRLDGMGEVGLGGTV